MTKRKDAIYLIAVLAFTALFINAIGRIPAFTEDVSHYPDMTYQEIIKEYDILRAEVNKPLSSWQRFFDTATKINNLRLACKKYNRQHSKITDPRIRDVGVALSPLDLLNQDNTSRGRAYSDKYPGEFEEARKRLNDKPFYQISFEENDEACRRFISSVVLFQLGFMPFVLLIYATRIRKEGGSVVFEAMSNPLLPVYLLLWEVGIFRYRASGMRRQIRRMFQYASFMLSAILSFGAATLKAQSRSKNDDGSNGGSSHTLVISGSAHYLPKYLGLDGAIFHPDPVLQSSLTITHKSGAYANFWKSVPTARSFLNPNFGFEEDYTVGFSRKAGKRTVDASLTYFNVTPLGTLTGGDLLQESITISNLIPKLPANSYIWVRNVRPLKGDKPPGGQFVHFGMSRTINTGSRTQLALSAEAVFDSGAFGFKRAGITRWSGAFKVPIGKIILDLPLIRISSPFTRPNDSRKFEQVVGVGLSFSFAN